MKQLFLLIGICFFGRISPVVASTPKDSIVSKDTTSSKFRKNLFAVPTFGSSPETGFYFGGVVLIDLIRRGDTLARHSVIKSEASFSVKNQFISNLEWALTDSARNQILIGENSWLRFPELFWGKGGNAPDDDWVFYDVYRLELKNTYYRRIQGNYYWGLAQQFQAVYNLQFPSKQPGYDHVYDQIETGISSGLGAGVLLDSRTNLLNPRAGEAMISVKGLAFGKIIGSDFKFGSLDVDARYYLKSGKKNVLAFQALGQMRTKGTPFRLLGLLGGPGILRGFYYGRYRDNNLFASQMEYRLHVYKGFGMTAFSAFGNVLNFSQPKNSGPLKSSAGIGFRFKIDKKENTNMRIDYAWTNDGNTGLYFSFGEAF